MRSWLQDGSKAGGDSVAGSHVGEDYVDALDTPTRRSTASPTHRAQSLPPWAAAVGADVFRELCRVPSFAELNAVPLSASKAIGASVRL